MFVMKSRNSIVQGYRLADQVHRHVGAPDLVGEDAKKMEAIDVVLVDRKDFLVVAFSFAKPAGLMMPQRRSQQFGYRLRGADGGVLHRRNGDLLPLFRCHSSLFSVHGEDARRAKRPPTYLQFAPCCAPAASGHAAAAPPSSVMNARRFTRSPRRRAKAESAALPGRASWRS